MYVYVQESTTQSAQLPFSQVRIFLDEPKSSILFEDDLFVEGFQIFVKMS